MTDCPKTDKSEIFTAVIDTVNRVGFDERVSELTRLGFVNGNGASGTKAARGSGHGVTA
jgi:hypothetical protein